MYVCVCIFWDSEIPRNHHLCLPYDSMYVCMGLFPCRLDMQQSCIVMLAEVWQIHFDGVVCCNVDSEGSL